MKASCLVCKGRDCKKYCGTEFCATCHKLTSMIKVKEIVKSDSFQATSPSPFVGRFGYPRVNVGILSPGGIDDQAWRYDAPQYWAEHKLKIPDIVDLRSSLLNSRFIADIRLPHRFVEVAQQVALSSKPVDLEFYLTKKPNFNLDFDDVTAPMGPAATLQRVKEIDNIRIDRKVDSVFQDKEFKANDAIIYLHDQGYDETALSRMLSVGTLGMQANRKLVPTRWSITATDDMISKDLIKNIRAYGSVECCAYFGSHLGNYYLILLFPEPWSYELFETNQEGEFLSTDFEPYGGRKDYASITAGGYYTVRLAVLEELEKMKKQASVLAIRIITDEYSLPLGVWVTREASRNAMKNKLENFGNMNEAVNYAKNFLMQRFGYDITAILEKSIMYKTLRKQSKLHHFFA